MDSSPTGRRILSIDGGGSRGLTCLNAIDAIMKAASLRARRTVLPYEVFDLICGTSTGGLLAILLGRLKMSCADALDAYMSLSEALYGADEEAFTKTLLFEIQTLDTEQFDVQLSKILSQYASKSASMLTATRRNPQNGRSAETFVTTVDDAPKFTNRLRCIKSYRVPPSVSRDYPPRHAWSIREAIRATLAAPPYLSPAMLARQYGFRDASFSGFNNPVKIACNEANTLWPDDPIELIVSVGTGFLAMVPPIPSWNDGPNLQSTSRITADILHHLPEEIREANSQGAVFVTKQYASIAAETESIHDETQIKYGTTYCRLNPPTGLSEMSLIDTFHSEVAKDATAQWIRGPEGQSLIADVANRLVEEVAAPTIEDLKPETAVFVPPPPPPEETNKGYHPQLDEKRPDTILAYLNNYQIIFVIDDSTSMKGRNWKETRDALTGIAEHALEYGSDEVDLCFFNSSQSYKGLKGSKEVVRIFDEVQPRGRTPTGATLKRIFEEQVTKLDRAINTPEYRYIRPMDIIVLTDGVPSDHPRDVIVEAVQRMKVSHHHPNSIGIQFVQIGNDKDAVDALKLLSGRDVSSLVDTVPYNGELTPERLERILLGGVHPNVRALLR